METGLTTPSITRGFIIGAPSTGSGKTTLTLGVIGALRRRGLVIAPAKVGPDFIDPGFHQAAAGRPSVNLDTWAMRPPLLDQLVATQAHGSDVLVVEGVMGLFDGAEFGEPGRCGSTADAARATGLPVILVVNAAGIAQSIAPIVRGLATFDPAVRIAGVILNRVSSERHQRMLTTALDRIDMPVFGAIPKSANIELKSRHLGLVQAEETADLEQRLAAIASLVEQHCDLDRLLAAAGDAAPRECGAAGIVPPGQRVAVANDVAFRFAYSHLLAGWRRAGAEILTFSPLTDDPPPAGADAIYLPGGYPELHAGRLAAATTFSAGLRSAAARSLPIYGECGGYMVLGNGLVDADGNRHAMLGLLGLETSFAARKLHLGYREVTADGGFPLGGKGSRFRAHEFHYASIVSEVGEPLFAVSGDGGTAGLRNGSIAGSFIHLVDRC